MNTAKNKKPLVLWHQADDENYVELLKKQFGANNIITSLEQLESIFNAAGFEKNFDESEYSGVILPVELNWEGRYFSEFFGVDLVMNYLRTRYSLRHPILFLSYQSLWKLRHDENGKEIVKHQIMGAVGHDYLQLPAAPKQWLAELKKISPLTSLQFKDVFHNLCRVKGLIGEKIHKLQGRFSAMQSSADKSEIRKEFEKGLNELINLFDDSLQIRKQRNETLQEFKEIDISSVQLLQNFLSELGEKLKSFVKEDEEFSDGEPRLDEDRPWKVLLLDDEPDIKNLELLREALKKGGITDNNLIIAESVDQAEKFIAEDIFNEIVVVVSDYRLFEKIDGIERQQRRQGYDFLADLVQSDRLIHLIALSGLSRKTLLESFQEYNARVDIFSKGDITGQFAVNLLAATILDRGEETYDALCSRPLGGDWDTLKPFYSAHRKAADFYQREKQINNRVRHFISEFNFCLENESKTKIEKLEELTTEKIEKLEELTTDMSVKDPHNSAHMEIFHNKLTARRIALWLKFKKYKHEEIYAILDGHSSLSSKLKELDEKWKDGKNKKPPKETLKANTTFWLRTRLAFREHVLEHALLVEERRWLKTEFDKDGFPHKFGVLGDISYFVQIGVENFFVAFPSVLNKLISTDEKRKLFHKSKLFIVSPKEAKLILCEIGGAVSIKEEKQKYLELLNVIAKNMKTFLGEHRSVDSFIYFLNELSQAKNPQEFYKENVLNQKFL